MLAVVMAACTTNADPTTTTTSGPTTTSLASTSTTSTPVQAASEMVPGDCPFDVPQGRTVECGTVELPADRDAPAAGTVVVPIAIFRSASDSPAPDPVVYLEGGPGGDALETLPLVFERSFAHLLADRDVVFFDQRGTGYSSPSLACPEVREKGFEMLEQVLTPEQQIEASLAVIEECRLRLVSEGVQLDTFSSAASVADLDDIRTALGYEEWNVYGISYGTRLALTLMRDRPEGVRSVVLDSVYPLEADLYSESPGNLDRALAELFEGCREDADCAAAYPDLEQTFYQTVADLQAEPVRALVTDLFTGEVYDAVFDGGAFGSVVFQALYSAEVIPVLPRLIDDVSHGELSDLALLTTSFLANGEYFSLGMQFSVQCNEEASFGSREATSSALSDYPQLAPVFDASINTGLNIFEVCDSWGAGIAEDVENEPVTSSIPTLVLAGEYDPITPPRWGEEAADSLGNSTYVLLPGVGHGSSASAECPQQLVRDFLSDPGATLDTGCVEGMAAPDFVTGDDPVSAVDLVPFEQSFAGVTLTGVTPDGWEEQAPGVWARAENGLDQTALVQQVAPGVASQQLLNLLVAQLGLEERPEPSATRSTGLGEWSIYEAEISGVSVMLALVDFDGGSAVVMLAASPRDIDALEEMVLLPALDAIDVR